MLQIDPKYSPILLEALEDLMYKVSIDLEQLKGGPLTQSRQYLTEKQQQIEKLQHLISINT